MKFLVLGCNGMAGHLVSLYLKERGHSVLGFDLSESKYVDSVAGNVFDTEKLRQLIIKGEYDTVINCIGILNQVCDQNKSLAAYINGYLPHFLADVTCNTRTQVIHMSTDCVFSGAKGGYVENDLKDNPTFYGRSKALGELDDNKNVTFRDSIVGPDYKPNGPSLLNWFMAQEGPINGFTNRMWTGLTTLELSKAMEYAAIHRSYGLFNLVPDHAISKYELVSLFNQYFRDGKVIINPIEGAPSDLSLKRTNFGMDYLIPDYDVMVAELAEWVKKHKDMYPHYNL